jgi:hypothetical protein
MMWFMITLVLCGACAIVGYVLGYGHGQSAGDDGPFGHGRIAPKYPPK